VIAAEELRRIHDRAYLLEQIPSYVTAITGAEPFLVDDHVAYVGEGRLVLIGYPLDEAFAVERLERALRDAAGRFEPQIVSVAAPEVPPFMEHAQRDVPDTYYRLLLEGFAPRKKVRNMVKRASRELEVVRDVRFRRAHRGLVKRFLHERDLDAGGRFIYERLGSYAKSPTARLYEARDRKGRLVAFDIAEVAAKDYTFYAFNLRAHKHPVPGASDLLLHALIEDAIAEGKPYVGLGLGLDPGVAFFKRKWGGVPHVPHVGSRQLRASGRDPLGR
jgi:hypothetical protein